MSKRPLITGIYAAITVAAMLLASALSLQSCKNKTDEESSAEEEEPIELLFGIDYRDYSIVEGEVASGETMSKILSGLGVAPAMIDKIDRASRNIFDLRGVRAGNRYTAFIEDDSTSHKLAHLVYEKNLTDYIVFTLHGDSVVIDQGQKNVSVVRRKCTATINSSLWGAILDNNLPPALAAELESIFAWSVDFFGIQKGDNFTVIYDERYIDTLSIGVGTIWGAIFENGGKEYYAIPFKKNGKVLYWDQEGNSLRKNLLKAPLKYTRISSRFSNSRLHPIYKVRRPHHGVDYAAPAGTPVHAVADGVITFKGWGGGGGNTLKIKHAGNLQSGYLHLKGYAKGMAVGRRVSQGELIGYVGSTGSSTGPHLDFRLWKNGTPIDPLKVPSMPTEPIAKADRAEFDYIKERILSELRGEISPEEVITDLDSIVKAPAAALPATAADNK